MELTLMRKKAIKYLISIALIAFLGFKSIYFRKLDEVKKESDVKNFDASAFARDFYDTKLLPRVDSAVDLTVLIPLLRTEPENAFRKYSHSLAIGNIRYFLVRGEGTIMSIAGDAAALQLKDQPDKTNINIATEFVYGNAIRDASGLLRLSDFSSTAEVNSISENINDIIRKEVLPPFVSKAERGSIVKFAGALELNQKYLDLDTIEIVPISLSVLE